MKNWWFVLLRSVARDEMSLAAFTPNIHTLTIIMHTGLSVHTDHTGTINDSGTPSPH
jgi:hypothetical protein